MSKSSKPAETLGKPKAKRVKKRGKGISGARRAPRRKPAEIRTPARRAEFLSYIRGGPDQPPLSGAHAALKTGLLRSQAYAWRYDDPAFAAEWDEAYQEGLDYLEDDVRSRARATSDKLAMFLLETQRPEKYTRRKVIIHNGDRSVGLIDMKGFSPEVQALIEAHLDEIEAICAAERERLDQPAPMQIAGPK